MILVAQRRRSRRRVPSPLREPGTQSGWWPEGLWERVVAVAGAGNVSAYIRDALERAVAADEAAGVQPAPDLRFVAVAGRVRGYAGPRGGVDAAEAGGEALPPRGAV